MTFENELIDAFCEMEVYTRRVEPLRSLLSRRVERGVDVYSSHIIFVLISVRKTTPPKNLQLNISISNRNNKPTILWGS